MYKIFFAGCDDYECAIVNLSAYYRYMYSYEALLPLHSLHPLDYLPYRIDHDNHLFFETDSNLLRDGLTLYSNGCHKLSSFLTKNFYKFTNCIADADMVVIDDYVNVSNIQKTIAISDKYKMVFLMNCKPDKVMGKYLKEMLSSGSYVREDHYIYGFTDSIINSLRIATVDMASILDDGYMRDCLEAKKPMCTVSQLLRSCNTPEGELDIDTFDRIASLLLSEDNDSHILGLTLLASMNFVDYTESIKYILNKHSLKYSQYTDDIHKMIACLNSIDSTTVLNKVYLQYCDSICKKDWNLLQDYVIRHHEEKNLHLLNLPFRTSEISDIGITYKINYKDV